MIDRPYGVVGEGRYSWTGTVYLTLFSERSISGRSPEHFPNMIPRVLHIIAEFPRLRRGYERVARPPVPPSLSVSVSVCVCLDFYLDIISDVWNCMDMSRTTKHLMSIFRTKLTKFEQLALTCSEGSEDIRKTLDARFELERFVENEFESLYSLGTSR